MLKRMAHLPYEERLQCSEGKKMTGRVGHMIEVHQIMHSVVAKEKLFLPLTILEPGAVR